MTDVRLFPASFQPWTDAGSERAVAVLMSGGVDSSVAALLLKEAGWRVLGITMRIPVAASGGAFGPCCGAEAALVCHALGIPHYFLGVEEAFEQRVIAPFRRAYAEGRTPSPCVDCNTHLKFRLVWDFVEETFGVSWLATGHYARVGRAEGQPYLARAADRGRDQSYFLYGIPRKRLPRLLLPLGSLDKRAVRILAHMGGLDVAEKPDSMELCFAGESDYRRALGCGGRQWEGPVLDAAGNVVGRHNGIFNYTLGQRRGVGIAQGRPLYVTGISPRDNTIRVGPRAEIERRAVYAEGVNLLVPQCPAPGDRLYGKIRSCGEPEACTVTDASDTTLAVEFDSPVFAPAPGQHLVLYDGAGRVVGGGCIAERAPVLESSV